MRQVYHGLLDPRYQPGAVAGKNVPVALTVFGPVTSCWESSSPERLASLSLPSASDWSEWLTDGRSMSSASGRIFVEKDCLAAVGGVPLLILNCKKRERVCVCVCVCVWTPRP